MEAETSAFYDDLAEYYDLIFEDWQASMARQGEAIARLLRQWLPDAAPPLRVLDAAAGIGTQSLPLATRGCSVTSRDLSPAAVGRLAREAAARGLALDTGVADMRAVDASVEGGFDAVIAFDNSLPHLLTDADLLAAFRSFQRALRPGGVCLLSVRDYDQEPRDRERVIPYGVRWRAGVRWVPLQVWRWVGADHYDTTFYLISDEPGGVRVRSGTARYYAVSTDRLLALLAEAGFAESRRLDETSYQPLLVARRPA